MKMFSCGGAGIYLTKHILFMEKEVHKIMLKVGVLHAPKPYVLKCPPQGLMSIAAYLREIKLYLISLMLISILLIAKKSKKIPIKNF